MRKDGKNKTEDISMLAQCCITGNVRNVNICNTGFFERTDRQKSYPLFTDVKKSFSIIFFSFGWNLLTARCCLFCFVFWMKLLGQFHYCWHFQLSFQVYILSFAVVLIWIEMTWTPENSKFSYKFSLTSLH